MTVTQLKRTWSFLLKHVLKLKLKSSVKIPKARRGAKPTAETLKTPLQWIDPVHTIAPTFRQVKFNWFFSFQAYGEFIWKWEPGFSLTFHEGLWLALYSFVSFSWIKHQRKDTSERLSICAILYPGNNRVCPLPFVMIRPHVGDFGVTQCLTC